MFDVHLDILKVNLIEMNYYLVFLVARKLSHSKYLQERIGHLELVDDIADLLGFSNHQVLEVNEVLLELKPLK